MKAKQKAMWGLVVAVIWGVVAGAQPLVAEGTESQWHGYTRYDFSFKGRRCFITQPKQALPSKPWVWRAKFPGYHDEIDKILVGQGFHIAHINCGAMLGSPKARDLWDEFYTYVTETAGLSKTVALEAVSRGGLYAYGWAARNPDKVTCIYGDTPVLDFKSWPGGKGKGIGAPKEWANLQKQYGFTEEQAMNSKDIPLNKLEPLAKAGIPIMHVISLVDQVVPAEENSLILEKKYRALGGSVTILPNQKGKYSCKGHHFPLDDPKRCASFIRDNTPLPQLEGSRPNIILVMTDDQGMGDLSCMGNPILKTPHLDTFHDLSTRFREYHVSPTCAPTRAALFSGRHEFRNGVTHTIHERDRMALSTTTFAELLAKNGYETGIFGKWHLGDEDEYQPYNRGFTEVLIHGAGGIGQKFRGSCGDFPPNRGSRKYFDNVLLHNDTIVQTKGFCTDVFFQAALGWIRKQHQARKPFFAYISPNAPHGPMIAPETYTKRWLDAGWDQNTAGRYGMIENIDDNFGLLMQKLDEWDAWDNTLVIFMTDNGQAGRGGKKNGKPQKMFTAGFKSGKCSAYEGGTHVPAFWRWKGVLGEGVDVNALCAHIDLYKTFCELAGAEIPDGIQTLDGRSMLPLLKDPNAAWADRELYTHVGRWKKDEDPNLSRDKKRQWAVRTQRWRLVDDELYDIESDPFEATSVASEHPEVVERLTKSYRTWWKETVPLMVNEDHPYPSENPQAVRYEKQLKERGIPDWEPALFK